MITDLSTLSTAKLSKAETLLRLLPLTEKSKVMPLEFFTLELWEKDSKKVVGEILKGFEKERSLVVRSSSLSEDQDESSMAGYYDSVINVDVNEESLRNAVNSVVESYGSSKSSKDQVLVQPMLTDVSMSGVLFTRDLTSGGPYYVINYDDTSGKTDTVTSGVEGHCRTLYIHRNHHKSLSSKRFKVLIEAVMEIEDIFDSDCLDIEFAITNSDEVVIFQVRKLATESHWVKNLNTEVDQAIAQIKSFFQDELEFKGEILGERTAYGVMPDWNPAEMIGCQPRKLAMSLYQYLITDSVWAEARAKMGYRNLSENPLMINLAGSVYIDIRKSFNSMLPLGLPKKLGHKLVNIWMDRLRAHPEFHDKVEFEVVTSFFPVGQEDQVRERYLQEGLTDEEVDLFFKSLKELSNLVLDSENKVLDQQLELIDQLKTKHDSLSKNLQLKGRDLLWVASSQLSSCKNLGTLPFSIIARCGFISESLLRGFISCGALSEERVAEMKRSIRTVTTEFLEDCSNMNGEEELLQAFFSKYGHLRPGTYDILSPRYDQRDLGSFRKSKKLEHDSFKLNSEEKAHIDSLLKTSGLSISVEEVIVFISKSIKGREEAKFNFTRNISDSLELVAKWGDEIGLSREDLSHLSIRKILRFLREAPVTGKKEHFLSLVEKEKNLYDIAQSIKLPHLILRESDIDIIPILLSKPNFVTTKNIDGKAVVLSNREVTDLNKIEGRIVLVEGADPGYDWIFSANILGLITKFGGANSHMAIRCAELGVPAAIGCGEQLFNKALETEFISLECGHGIIRFS